jgi:hypothetical protein
VSESGDLVRTCPLDPRAGCSDVGVAERRGSGRGHPREHPPDGDPIGQEGDHLHLLAAAGADEGIDLERPGQDGRPTARNTEPGHPCVKEFLAELVNQTDVQQTLRDRALAGDTTAFFRAVAYVLGKPRETVDMNVSSPGSRRPGRRRGAASASSEGKMYGLQSSAK